MIKIFLTVLLVLYSTSSLSTQYMCEVNRTNGESTTGIINEDNNTVSFVTLDNKEVYTSGKLFELKPKSIRFKHKAVDNVAFCTNVETTAIEDNLGNREFKFQNTVSGISTFFTNCEEFEQPPVAEDSCDIPIPEPSVCPSTEPKKIDEPLPKKDKKPSQNKPQKPKNPFNADKKIKHKPKKPTPNDMCPT